MVSRTQLCACATSAALLCYVAAAQADAFAACYSAMTTERKMYVSPVIETDADPATLKLAFEGYLREKYGYAPKYGYSGFLTCYSGMLRSQAEVVRKDALNNNADGRTTTVETDWNGPPGAHLATGPPPPPEAPKPKPGALDH